MKLRDLAVVVIGVAGTSVVFSEQDEPPEPPLVAEGMDNTQLQSIIERVDPEFAGQPGFWQLRVGGLQATVITDPKADRMRIVIPIRRADELDRENLTRVLQANFDSALDARYAIAKGLLWSTYIHPLSALSEKEFLYGLGQAVNIVTSYGRTYSSGAWSFGGGDSRDLLERRLLEELMKKGDVI